MFSRKVVVSFVQLSFCLILISPFPVSGDYLLNPSGSTVAGDYGFLPYGDNNIINQGIINGGAAGTYNLNVITVSGNIIDNSGSVLNDIFGVFNDISATYTGSTGNTITNSGEVGGCIFGSLNNFWSFYTGPGNTIYNSGKVDGWIVGTLNKFLGIYTATTGNMIINSGKVGVDIVGTYNEERYTTTDGNIIINSGEVDGWIIGVENYTSYTGTGNTITNTGEVHRDIVGSYNSGMYTSTKGNIIINSGKVDGWIVGTENYGGYNGPGNTIYNSGWVGGSIYGDYNMGVSFTGGDDTITNSGVVVGSIYGGEGNDTIILIGGSSLGGVADGGVGTDTLGLNNMGSMDGSTIGSTYLNFENLEIYGGTTSFNGTWDIPNWNTTLYNGNLYINGSLNTNLFTIYSSGVLGGTGNINGSVINYGTISPGNSIGTLTVNGPVTFMPGSVFKVELGHYAGDRLSATGAVTINGGTVYATLYRALYPDGSNWRIINAAGGISGSFAALRPAFVSETLQIHLTYGPTGLTVVLDRTPFSELATTSNQQEIASAFDKLVPQAGGGMQNLIVAMDFDMDLGQIRDTFNAMNPEMYTAYSSTGLNSSRIPEQTASMRQTELHNRSLFAETNEETALKRGWSVWTRALGRTSDRDAEDSYLGYSHDTTGFVLGADGKLTDWLLAGLSIGYSDSDLNWDGTRHDGSVTGRHIGLYASAYLQNSFIDGYLGYADLDNSAARDISFSAVSVAAGSDFDSSVLRGRIEGGYDIRVKNLFVTPLATLDYARFDRDGFTETGADYLNLQVEESDAESLATNLGVRVSGLFTTGQWQLMPSVRLGWLHELKDDNPTVTASFADYNDAKFTVTGVAPAADYGVLEVGLVAEYGSGLSLFIDYGGALADGSQSHLISGGLSWRF